MAKAKKEKPYLLLDDVKYLVENMSEEQRIIYDHLLDLERKIHNIEFNLVQLRYGKKAFIGEYQATLKPTTEV
jgi:hypothetical protein|tara:strand:+ start:90 stop:308 length:219 start_codon:yes stop_codon:yes gene_type:complete